MLWAVIAIFGWDRYRGNRTSVGGDSAAQPTGEVFIDPDTGRRTRVWYDPGTGKRDYAPTEGSGPFVSWPRMFP